MARSVVTAHDNAEKARARAPRRLGDLVADAIPAVVSSDEEIRRIERANAERKRRNNAVLYWTTSQVPKKYRHVTIEPEWNKIPEAIGGQAVRAPYRVAFDRVLSLEKIRGGAIVAMLGDRGPGKTWMACCLVKRFCRASRMAMYCEALDYFVALRATYGDRGVGTEIEVEAKYLRPELMVIDAVEEKSDTPAQQQMLVRLLNKRLMDEKLTLLVSNDDGGSLPDRIGNSLVDRMNDGGGIVNCHWPSLRGHL